jgi:hypothetical protein
MNHYFPKLIHSFKAINDFRQQGKVKYTTEVIMSLGMIERLGGFKSNNEFELFLQTSTEIENNISTFLNTSVDELPSIDAFNYFFQRIPPDEIRKIMDKMFRELERKKFLNQLKTRAGEILLAIDGVQVFSTKREIGHSINREHKENDKTYHQYFVEAKIVSKQGFVISLDTEVIENPTEEFDKQDCERKAAVRLLERIGRKHPHLKFRILGDALFCNSKVIDLCNKHKWSYSFTFKGKTQYPKLLSEINDEYNYSQRNNHCRRFLRKNKNYELHVDLRWCNNVAYDLGEKGERGINFLEGKIIKIRNGMEEVVTTFSFLVSEPISEINALRIFQICRQRWKIENEGFNFQKNNILHIGHSFSSVGYAAQNFYLLAQLAHTIIQLASFTDIAGQVRRQTTGGVDNLSQSLKKIFKTFGIIAQRIRIEFLEKVFKPPLSISMRVRLKLA